ncbi:GLPGLI family protein [Chitinophaga agrisoli]|uniref:GLPGLI family protein n=1 Tax=Chitinophaga agrisoli TaxID=2607653 RepID=A0A5B2VNY6_9BACT|nr:GLPGLI family protein [Chitinophaga agrisoli]KAA2240400.1 GLPGLI family protein [Chitinophaga agrisoli]
MRSLLLCILLLTSAANALAQSPVYLTTGRIEFEKRLNVYARLDEMFTDNNSPWKEMEKKRQPRFKITYFDLLFRGNNTLYTPGRDNPDNIRLQPEPGDENVIYDKLDTHETIAQKKAFEQVFLIKDSTRAIKWKITDEKRNIAGFDCRRANAVIMDSIYVVAFYTDAIVTPGGPESFTGLPGMILGVALPYEHITWFATKVLSEDVQETALKVPVKGKKMDNKGFRETINGSLKDWGPYGKTYMKVLQL